MNLYRITLRRSQEVKVVAFSPNFTDKDLSHPLNEVREDWGILTVDVKAKTIESAEKRGLKQIYSYDGYKEWVGRWKDENNNTD